MAFPSISNISGANPGPNSATIPDTVQMPVGNMWKIGTFSIQMAPAALAAGPSVAERTFVGTAATSSATQYFPAIGLQVGDFVQVEYNGAQTANVAVLDARVSAADTLAVKFLATAGTPTPAAGTAAAPYLVNVYRVQPNWTVPASPLPQIDY